MLLFLAGRSLSPAGVAAVLSLLAFAPAPAESHHDEGPTLAALSWLTGSWCSQSEKGTAEEHWFPPHGGVILGVHRDVRDDKAFFEFLRIVEEDGGLVYYASPAGRPATPFRLVEWGERKAVFANPEHDYPQRILYRLEEGTLSSTIEGDVDGETRSSTWRWRRDACSFLEAD